jgi:hypothetical protein
MTRVHPRFIIPALDCRDENDCHRARLGPRRHRPVCGGPVTYEAVVEKNGKKTEVAINAAGKPIKS